MSRFLLFLILLVVATVFFSWTRVTALPDWYDASALESSNDPVEELSKILERQGIQAFLGAKLTDLLAGKLILDQDEFNALILTSIAVDEGGQKLLSVSDVIKTQINSDHLEIGSVIDMDKLKQLDGDIREKIDELTGVLPILDRDKVYLAISGQPQAREGELAFTQDVALKVGKLTIPNALLAVMGVSTEPLQQQSLKISYLRINDVSLENNKIGLAVRPDF